MGDNGNDDNDDDSSISVVAYNVDRKEMNRLIQEDYGGDQEPFDQWRIMIENRTYEMRFPDTSYHVDMFCDLPPMDLDHTSTYEAYARTLLDREIVEMKLVIDYAKENPKTVDIDDLIEAAEFFQATLMQHMKVLDLKEQHE
jgi:hypothetical protein